jgi:SOS-response transcriptional repressor LexA
MSDMHTDDQAASDDRPGWAQRMRRVVAEEGISQGVLARWVEYTQSSLSRLLSGRAQSAPLRVLANLTRWATDRGWSAEWLWTGRDPARRRGPAASLDTAALLEATEDDLITELARLSMRTTTVQQLLSTVHDPARRQAVIESLGLARRPLQSEDYRVVSAWEPGYEEIGPEDLPADWPSRYVPVVGHAAAGSGVDTSEAEQYPPGVADSYVRVEAPPPHAFAIRVVGDSMAPAYQPSDMVVVDPARTAEPGEPGVIVYEDPDTGQRRARLKRLQSTPGGVRMESVNPEYDPVDLPGEAVIIAYAVWRHLPWRQPG